jgi:hypothetical protein
MDKIKALFDGIKKIFYSPEAPNEIVSNNAKTVLYGLFILIGLVILMYAISVVVAYSPPFLSPDESRLNDNIVKNILNGTGDDQDKLDKLRGHYQNIWEKYNGRVIRGFQQMDQLNGVYIAAISGAIALGGTLISQIWGREHQ